MDEQKKLNEGFTEFGNNRSPYSLYFYPIGRVGKFFSKFFTNQGAEALVNQDRQQIPANAEGNNPKPAQPLHGDAINKPDIIKASQLMHRKTRYPILPEQEYDRKRRSKEYEDMDTYPEIGSAFDIFADDCVQKHIDGSRWEIQSDSRMIKDEVEELFDTIKLETFLWDIVRNTVKYGDCFIELIVDLENIKRGIQRIKILNPNFILRVEDEFGYLDCFLQEIPDKDDWSTYGGVGEYLSKEQILPLDKNQLVHFRLHTSDPSHYPYGKSIAAPARGIYRSLKMMEDAMLIYRLARAPERRIFYIDTGNLPASKAEMHLENQIKKFKKSKVYNRANGGIDERWDPLSADEDFYISLNGKQSGTKIETLPGAENLGEVDDVKYFRDKLLAALKIPKDYIVEKDQSPERKANLAQLDVKFARTIARIQQSIEIGLETLAKRHLIIKGFPYTEVIKLKIRLPEPSDMSKKRMLDLDEQKARVVQAVKGLGIFPMDKLYKDYYELNDTEIKEIKDKLEEEMMDPVYQNMAMMSAGAMAGPGMAPGQDPTQGGGMDSNENIPPTTPAPKESKEIDYDGLRYSLVDAGASDKVINLITELKLKSEKNKIIVEESEDTYKQV